MQVQLLLGALTTWPVLLTAATNLRSVPGAPQARACGLQVPYGSLTQPSGGTGIRATLRTSCPLGHASSTLALATDIAGAAGAQLTFIRSVRSDRYRDLQLRVGQCSFGPHKPELPGATPGPATYGQVRKQAKRSRRERGDFVGSTPTSVTDNDPVVQRRRRLRDMQESAGSIPAGITFDDWSVGVLGGTRPW